MTGSTSTLLRSELLGVRLVPSRLVPLSLLKPQGVVGIDGVYNQVYNQWVNGTWPPLKVPKGHHWLGLDLVDEVDLSELLVNVGGAETGIFLTCSRLHADRSPSTG